MRICIIGNSHVGALKEGWDNIAADHPGTALTFFAARGDRLEDMVADEGTLRAGGSDAENLRKFLAFTSGGTDHIAGDGYDLFVVYGCNLNFVNMSQVYSQAVMACSVADRIHGTMHHDLTQKLRRVTDRPILVAGNPLRTSSPDEEGLYEYERVLAEFQKVYDPLNARFIAQPPETRDAQNRTLEQFATGSRRLDVGRGGEAHDQGDNRHMNADYGRIWLSHFFQVLPAMTG